MDDSKIIELYFSRDETAINETSKKYEQYLFRIAFNILKDSFDCDESLNDTYLKTWNSIPPQTPSVFSAFLAKITRSCSIDIYRRKNRVKRQPDEYSLSIDELSDCISGNSADDELNYMLLGKSISSFLRNQKEHERTIFVMRYFFSESIQDISCKMQISYEKTKLTLFRTRKKLKEHLLKEGFEV